MPSVNKRIEPWNVSFAKQTKDETSQQTCAFAKPRLSHVVLYPIGYDTREAGFTLDTLLECQNTPVVKSTHGAF